MKINWNFKEDQRKYFEKYLKKYHKREKVIKLEYPFGKSYKSSYTKKELKKFIK